MRKIILIPILLILQLLLLAGCAFAQQESALGADFRGEGERFKRDCEGGFSIAEVGACADLLFTDHPLHIAVGSIAPQNGIGFGLAMVAAKDLPAWRLSWNFDGIVSTNSSWRAGAYMKAIYTPREKITVSEGGKPKKPVDLTRRYTVFNAYAQSISLNELFYFGLIPGTDTEVQSDFGMRETIPGISVSHPLFQKLSILHALKLSVLGEANGRFVNIAAFQHTSTIPPVAAFYDQSTLPGVFQQPATAQFGEGVGINPVLLRDHVTLNYTANFQQFVTPGASYSFRRWNGDFANNFSLYGKSKSPALHQQTNGPDECAVAPGQPCPRISQSHTRNLEGSIGFEFMITESYTSRNDAVPFYFDPTLGGSDVNGDNRLGSYPDYRFRAPNFVLLRETFEHSIWGPLGAEFLADQGNAFLTRELIDFGNLRETFGAGITIRAGGLPLVYVLFCWGGQGNHTIFNLNNSLLGGASRPSLY